MRQHRINAAHGAPTEHDGIVLVQSRPTGGQWTTLRWTRSMSEARSMRREISQAIPSAQTRVLRQRPNSTRAGG